jgi:integrase
VEHRWVRENPLDGTKRPSPPEKRPAFLKKEEYVHLIQTIDHRIRSDGRSQSLVWIRDWIQLAVGTGLRRNELSHLRWRDVDLAKGVIHVTQYGSYRTKSGKDRTVPLFPIAREVFERLECTHELVFASSTGKPRDKRMVTRRFYEMRKLAGINDDISLHSLRDTFASWLATDGVNLRLLQDWLGHSSILMTERYAWLLPTDASRYDGAFVLPE